ncbi:MAG: acetyl-CoA hydrolase/transferase C-terminal domain-containing protein, partial [Pseudomonadota bacterium]
SVDFMRASKASKGGRSVVAMASTARGGSVSRIVPTVEMVTALRTDVDIVVTEFGVAELFDAPLQERAERLIAVAHPDFQDQLRYGD